MAAVNDPYEIERFRVPGLPPKFRVAADRGRWGFEYGTRAEAEKRREELKAQAGR
ncbi:hypothetical protein [Streptomyces sp. NPDC003720]|uniref:hypothetical protein n=1 Tax=Streptomyces sp. NPDC003720 TaxID=3364684 RepID=UPI003683035A